MSSNPENLVGSDIAADVASFSSKYFRSDRFDKVFQGAMALIDETTAYLEGPGREEAKKLSPDLSFAYSTETMRLTTRLMQIASWLMIRRAVISGEMSADRAVQEEQRIKLKSIEGLAQADNFVQLPATLRSLTIRSLKLYERVLCMEKIVTDSSQIQHDDMSNDVRGQQSDLRFAFGGEGRS